MIAENSFSKGIQQDISKLKYPQDAFLEGWNIRILTDEGLSSLAIENTKGTTQLVTIPRVGWGGYFTPALYYGSGTPDVVVTIYDPTGGPPITAGLGDISQKSTEEIYQELLTDLETTGLIQYYKIAYNQQAIFIQLLEPNDVVNLVTITWDTGSGTQTDDFEVLTGNASYAATYEPFILGWGLLNEEFIVLVCDRASVSPTPTNEVGQIWKFKLNQIDGTTTINAFDNLIYNNVLNFSREYLIYNKVKTRYESVQKGTVVFTDFYNELRIANVFDPQLLAVFPQLLSYKPPHAISLPIVTKEIVGGLLPVGTYQYWYRLRSLQGASSTFCTQSSPVQIGPLLFPASSTASEIQTGADPGTPSQKSLEVVISEIDENYDLIEVGYTVYQTPDAPESFYIATLPIPPTRQVTVVHNGTENQIPIEVDEGTNAELLNNLNRPPDVFKTIEVLRNRLYAANAKTFSRSTGFDARAYRFNSARSADLYNGEDSYGNPTTVITGTAGGDIADLEINGVSLGTDLTQIPDNYDLINPYNNEDPTNALNDGDWEANSQYKYQADGTTLGGQGPNISYRFTTVQYRVDERQGSQTPHFPPFVLSPPGNVFLQPGNGFDIPAATEWANNYSSTTLQQIVGYARGEVYRFAIVFRDLAGFPFFADWIGDIKFPDNADSGYELTNNTILSNAMDLRIIGIEFTLDTTTDQFKAIKDKISGWEIVRVERTLQNKTKLGQGLITPVIDDGTYTFQTWLNSNNASQLTDVVMMDTPNFRFLKDNQFSASDYIKLIAETTVTSLTTIDTLGYDLGFLIKYRNSDYYNFSDPEYTRIPVDFKWVVGRVTAEQIIDDPLLPFPFFNMAGPDGTATSWQSSGEATDLLKLGDPIDWTNMPAGSEIKYLASYERYLQKQYGGNLRFNRYDNVYIPTGAVVQYTGQVTPTSVKTFGGDCYTVLFDLIKQEANWPTVTGVPNSGVVVSRVFHFFAAEAHGFNVEMRYPGFRRAAYKIDLQNDDNLYQDFSFNDALGQANNLQKFYSPPFNVVDLIEEPHSIYVTDPKLDNQQYNSWRNFRVLDTLTVNGNYGPINTLLEFKEKLFFWQNDAVGITANEERITVTTENGEPTTIGTGTVLQRYDYISTQTGCFHEFAPVKTGQALYHYDIYLNKLFRITKDVGSISLSDVKGLSGFFRYAFNGNILILDKLGRPNRAGIHSVFNPEFNTVLFTFIDDDQKFTLSYNEGLDGFDATKHSFTPSMYLNTRRRLHSVYWDGSNHNTIYTHWKGPYNFIYDQYFPSYVKMLTNGQSPLDKTWDNQEFRTEVTLNGQNLPFETFHRLRYTNDYQTTNTINLTPQQNIKRMLRTWRVQIPMDQTNPSTVIKPRMMDKYLMTELWFDQTPGEERRFVLHDVITEYSLRGKIMPK